MSRILLFPLAILAIAAAPALANQTGPDRARETKDRLAPEKMEALVAAPLRAARKGDLPAAERALGRMVDEARRRRGGAVREADLLTSFAIQLYILGSENGQDGVLSLSIDYMRRAVAATKRAFGDRHPETALALHSYADMLLQVRNDYPPGTAGAALVRQPSNPTEEAEAALAEALAIRQSTLGPDNIETLGAMRSLARAKVARPDGDFTGAIELLQRAIGIAVRITPPPDLRPTTLRLILVEAYAKAGRAEEALREARIAADEAKREDGAVIVKGEPCIFHAIDAKATADRLQTSHPSEAEALRRLFPDEDSCLQAIVDGIEDAVKDVPPR